MSITYPLTPPTVPGFRNARLTGHSVVGISRSPFTLQTQVQEFGGRGWQLEIELPPMRDLAIVEPWLAFLMSLNGRKGTFLHGDPLRNIPRGPANGTPLVDGASQTGQALNTKGWVASQTPVLRAGDYFQLGTGSTSRLYKVLQDVNSDGAGLAALDIWPSLRSSPADNDPITISNPRTTFRLLSDEAQWSEDYLAMYGVAFAAEEAL